MTFDAITVGGGLAGSTLATALARAGRKVLVLEREIEFKDRVRGENMLPWGVAAARRLGLVDDLLAAGAHQPRSWNTYMFGNPAGSCPYRVRPRMQPSWRRSAAGWRGRITSTAERPDDEGSRGRTRSRNSSSCAKRQACRTHGSPARSRSGRSLSSTARIAGSNRPSGTESS